MDPAPAVVVVALLASALVVGRLGYPCVGDCAKRAASWPAARWTLLVATVVCDGGIHDSPRGGNAACEAATWLTIGHRCHVNPGSTASASARLEQPIV